MRSLWGIVFALMCVSSAAAHTGVHEHGVADVKLVQDGRLLLVEFEGALDNLVGFEHPPRDESQQQALIQADLHLRQTDGLFILPENAGCKSSDVYVELPFVDPEMDASRDHADFHVSYQFDCTQPEALAQIEFVLFDRFPRIQRLRVVTAISDGQSAATLNPSRRILSF